MTAMTAIYFSGTGNSRHAIEYFCKEYDAITQTDAAPQPNTTPQTTPVPQPATPIYSIEDSRAAEAAKNADMIIFAYPIQFSTVPKIMRDYVTENKEIWKGKKVFMIATMGLFSGDGAGYLGRLLKRYGAEVVGGLHLKMPDSIGDVKALKRPLEKDKELVKEAEQKIKESVRRLKEGNPTREGIGFFYRVAGIFGQRLYFGHKTKTYSSKLKINADKCIGCGKCEKLCPMNNITIRDGKAVPGSSCTMCYRCINKCPEQAITLLGKTVIEQCGIEKYT